jgi:7,8-dihydropterin-6-yl-methyl-4-(beta-D-ribofuranosyl)aminobenzene 5'-phosphate synthase
VFDNYVLRPGLIDRWGFAAIVKTPSTVVLFDTGTDGTVLLSNMRQMGLAADEVTAIVVSHIHKDHSGGLGAFLKANPRVAVYLPASFPNSMRRMVRRAGARPHDVHGPTRIAKGIHTTGEMDGPVHEQALIVETQEGLVVLTGCAHPGIVRMVEQAKAVVPGKPVHLVMGGFHLMGASAPEIDRVIRAFRRLGVKRVAPSHCTGDQARARLEKAFGADYVPGGLGGVLMFR